MKRKIRKVLPPAKQSKRIPQELAVETARKIRLSKELEASKERIEKLKLYFQIKEKLDI